MTGAGANWGGFLLVDLLLNVLALAYGLELA